MRAAGFFKSLYFLPVVTSFVIISGIWAWLFKGTEYGMINYVLSWLGIEPQLFFSNSSQALPVLAGLSIFKVAGSTMVYYYAGLKSIPNHLYEAAKIDGAGRWRTFWSVTFPLLLPIHFTWPSLRRSVLFKSSIPRSSLRAGTELCNDDSGVLLV